MNRHLVANAMQRQNINLLMTDGKNSNEKQIADVKWLVSQNIDLLMVSPNEAEALTPVITEVYNKGIPVILIDRKTGNDSYTCFIGANNTVIGEKAADYVGLFCAPGSKILELHGQTGASAAVERGTGFNSRINGKYGDKKITHIGDLYCEWSSEKAKQKMTEYINEGKELPDIIYSHNDDMAIGAYDALKEAGINPENIIIIGTDGASGENGGIKAVLDGKIDATFFYPDGSEEAIKTAEEILSGKQVPKNIDLSTVQIDDNNADGLYGQMNMTRIQEERIIEQNEYMQQTTMKLNTTSNALILVISLLGAVLVALAYISKLHSDKKKSNQMLNEKNAEINAQKEELESQASYLNQINEQLERNKEKIIGSIRYAQTIQTAALPTESDLNYYFNSFVVYHPKDIVSGDFYWYHREVDTDKETHIFGVIDCTGHGVPGALLSMMGISALKDILGQLEITGGEINPSTILQQLRVFIKHSFNKNATDPRFANDDGMDMSICVLRPDGETMDFAGANQNAIIVHNGKITRIKGDFMPIGNYVKEEDFTTHQVKVSKGDMLYLFTDGIPDQLGGADFNKYSLRRLISHLAMNCDNGLDKQMYDIEKDIELWMGQNAQLDDITLLRIRI
jgi:ABC-type sugar transport system substrate-binding protein